MKRWLKCVLGKDCNYVVYESKIQHYVYIQCTYCLDLLTMPYYLVHKNIYKKTFPSIITDLNAHAIAATRAITAFTESLEKSLKP